MVISFHSLEDRIVKQFIAREAARGSTAARRSPRRRPMKLRGAGPRQAAARPRCAANPRSRSAIMRVAERTRRAAGGMTRARTVLAAGRAAGQRAATWCRRRTSRAACSPSSTARRARRASSKSSTSACRPKAQAQATPLRVEKLAREQLQMRTATPAVTQYVRRGRIGRAAADGCSAQHGAQRRRQRAQRRLHHQPAAGQQDAAVAQQVHRRAGRRWASCVLARPRGLGAGDRQRLLPASRARCASRARWSCRPTAAASSTATACCWPPACRCPASGRSRRTWSADTAQRAQLARLLGMTPAELDKQARGRRQASSGSSARSTSRSRRRSPALGIKGVYQRKEYQRQYPEGEAAAHVVGFTNVEDHGQEGIELAFQQGAGRPRRLAPRDQGPPGPRRRGRRRAGAAGGRPATSQLSIDSKVQFFAYQRCATRCAEHKAKAGSVVVLDVADRRGAGAGQLPELRARQAPEPDRRAAAQPRADRHLRARLDDEALHRRAGAGDRPRHAADA